MTECRQWRGWILVAAIVIGIALLALFVPHGHACGAPDWLAIVPVIFVGIISPLGHLSPVDNMPRGRLPGAPLLPALFRRPPPLGIA